MFWCPMEALHQGTHRFIPSSSKIRPYSQLTALDQTHLMVRLEVIFNQLVFLHALRTRVSTATTDLEKNAKKPDAISAPAPTQEALPVPAAHTEVSPAETDTTSPANTLQSPSSSNIAASVVPGSSVKGEANKGVAAARKASVQAGGISNLITVDAENLVAFLELTAGDFL
jgi:hypothetical protein